MKSRVAVAVAVASRAARRVDASARWLAFARVDSRRADATRGASDARGAGATARIDPDARATPRAGRARFGAAVSAVGTQTSRKHLKREPRETLGGRYSD